MFDIWRHPRLSDQAAKSAILAHLVRHHRPDVSVAEFWEREQALPATYYLTFNRHGDFVSRPRLGFRQVLAVTCRGLGRCFMSVSPLSLHDIQRIYP